MTIEMTCFFVDQTVGNPVLISRLGDVFFQHSGGHPILISSSWDSEGAFF